MAKPYSTESSVAGGEQLTGKRNWQEGLLPRRYLFPASGETDQNLSIRIEHDGAGFFFPLGTPDPEKAAVKARGIYEVVAKQGWTAANLRFSRELIVAFEWCLQPVMWTYTTIHTLVGKQTVPEEKNMLPREASRQRVVVVEMDAGIRRALCWSIDQQAGLCSIPCAEVEAFEQITIRHKPQLALLNRDLAGRLRCENPGTIGLIQPGLTALTYSVYADGDHMFLATPGGADGYLVKRVQPDRLLEPITNAASPTKLLSEDLLAGVKAYFQKLLQAPSPHDNSALAKLTPRENEVLALLSKGCMDKEIAHTMGISVWTVHGHMKSIFERLKVHTRTEAVIRYLEK